MILLLLLLLQAPGAAEDRDWQAWIEAGRPVTGKWSGLDAGGRQAVVRAVGHAARLPADWKRVLGLPLAGPELALRIAHDGLPAGADWEAVAAALPGSVSPELRARLAAGALAPERVSGHPPAEGASRRRAIDQVLAALMSAPDLEAPGVLLARVRPYLGTRELESVFSALLKEDGGSNRQRALALMREARFPVARPFLLRIVLDRSWPAAERGLLLDVVLLGGGRPVLEQVLAVLGPGTPDSFFRRLLTLWQDDVRPEDLPLLERMVRTGPRVGRHFALQVWARNETDPDRRLELFDLAVAEPDPYRGAALESLARRGAHAGIAERLLAHLDSTDREMRAFAMALLPSFGSPERLAEEYSQRMERGRNPAERAEWARLLAHLPVPAARRQAAEWLVGGGWRVRPEAWRVVAGLENHAEADPLLAGFLFREEVPEDLRFRLALSRAEASPDALEYLRSAVDAGSGVVLAFAVEELASAGEREDVLFLAALARDPDFDPTARAAAVRGLAARPEARETLARMLDEPPREYEVAEALVKALVRSGPEELRAGALAAARAGMGFTDPEERRGLRSAAWRAQLEVPRAGEAEQLGQQLRELLEAVPEGEDGRDLADPRRLARENLEIDSCARALGATGSYPGCLREWTAEGIAPSPLLFAASLLAKGAPALAMDWSRTVADRPDVGPGGRVRALATLARAAQAVDPREWEAALERLLRRPWDLRSQPWDLSHGLADKRTRAWSVPGDRLAELRVLARAAGVPARERAELLRGLLAEYTDPGVLEEAAAMVLADPDGAALAVQLARRAMEWDPADAAARVLWARALEAHGEGRAEEAWRQLLSFPLAGEDQRGLAREALQRLQGGG